MREYLRLHFGDRWVDPVTQKATEKPAGCVSMGSSVDVDRAAKAARAAFDRYSQTSVAERVAPLERMPQEHKKRCTDMVAAITVEMGAPAALARNAQAAIGVAHLQSALQALKGYRSSEERGSTLPVHEPIGVRGFITPWNWPINQIACEVASALAVGCPMVLKPSKIAPFPALIWTEIMGAAGVPAGVFNLVNGDRPTVGAAITGHPEVDMVYFTGENVDGR